MKCQTCQKKMDDFLGDYGWNNWLKLMHYFEHELSEEEITNTTFEEMTNALMSFKPWVEIKTEK